jgi:hypothetical protein
MKKVHPDMRDIPQKDLLVAYNSLAHHTPDILADPLLGGQTLKQMAQYRVADVNTLGAIAKIKESREKALSSVPWAKGHEPLVRGIQEGVSGLGEDYNQ